MLKDWLKIGQTELIGIWHFNLTKVWEEFLCPKKLQVKVKKRVFFCVVELIQTEGGFRMWQEEAAGLKMMRDIHMFDISGFSSDWFQVPISVVKIWDFFPLAFQRSGHFRTSVQYSWGLLLGHVEFSLCAFFSPPPSGVVDDDEMP